jgi:hypothetical protein
LIGLFKEKNYCNHQLIELMDICFVSKILFFCVQQFKFNSIPISNIIPDEHSNGNLTYHIVRMKIEGLDVTREVSMGKLYAAQLMRKVADGCLQIYGGLGYMNEMLISRFYRDARLLSIGGGAEEVMREIITRVEGF